MNIRIETTERGGKRFDELVLYIGDMHFRKQVTCERDVMLAYRLAEREGWDVFDTRTQAQKVV